MTRSMRCNLVALAFGACALAATVDEAHAAEPAQDPAALALFRKGRELIAREDWAGGCEKLAQSFARYESASTLINLGRCDEHAGKMASAWSRYVRAKTLAASIDDTARRQELTALAESSAADAERKVARLTIRAARPMRGLVVTDEQGQALPVGEAVPLDAGAHRLFVYAPGFRENTFDVALIDGRTTEFVATLVEESTRDATAHEPITVAAPASALAHPATTTPAAPAHSFPWSGFALGAVGVALGGAAIAFGSDAARANSSLHDHCGPNLQCPTNYDPSDENARKNRGFGLAIGLGVGSVAALGVGTWMIVSHKDSPVTASVAPDRVNLRVVF